MLLRKSKGRENTIRVLIERNPHIGGPLQFQPMLFNGQLYNLLSLPPKFWFCSSGVGPDDLQFRKFPGVADAASRGNRTWITTACTGLFWLSVSSCVILVVFNFVHFFYVVIFVGIMSLTVFFTARSVVISLGSFLILVICAFSHLFLDYAWYLFITFMKVF